MNMPPVTRWYIWHHDNFGVWLLFARWVFYICAASWICGWLIQ